MRSGGTAAALALAVSVAACGAPDAPVRVTLACEERAAHERERWEKEPLPPLPTVDELDACLSESEKEQRKKRRALGRELFWSGRLSKSGAGEGRTGMSCGTCHAPEHWGTSGTRFVAGVDGKVAPYHVPTSLNAAFNQRFTWGGFETSLEAVSNRALVRLMGSPAPKEPGVADPLMEALSVARSDLDREHRSFGRLFIDAYRGSPLEPRDETSVSRAALLDALAEYMRTIAPRGSLYDRWMRAGQRDEEWTRTHDEGFALFKDLGCVSCHQGRNVGGNMLAKFGVMQESDLPVDPGAALDEEELPDDRSEDARARSHKGLANDTASDNKLIFVDEKNFDDGVFRVPSLRNVAMTAPYFHDGRVRTLRSAIRIMAWKQLGRRLTDDEVQKLSRFLEALTGTIPPEAQKPEALR